MLPLGTICKNHTLDLDFHVMLKHIEIMVVNKHTGEVIHDFRKTANLDVEQDFDEWFMKFARGFIRLLKKSSDNVINISCEDYKRPQQLFLDVY